MLSLILALALGSWGPSCASVEAPVAQVSQDNLPKLESGYEWRQLQGDPNRSYLYRGNVQVGGWDHALKLYRPYDADKDVWSDPTDPPWLVKNFGITVEKLHADGGYSFCGEKTDWKFVQAMFGSDRLEDDSQKLRLTVIGPKAECDRVLTDLKTHPSLAEYSNKFVLQSYRPGDWATRVFKDAGNASFYLSIQKPPKTPGGEAQELHAQRAYAGPELLAAGCLAAVRKANPNYDPSKTPDLSKPKPLIDGDTNWLLWVGGAALAYFFLSGSRK